MNVQEFYEEGKKAVMMHPVFLGIWVAFLAYVMTLEFFVDPMMQRPALWIAALVWFGVVELMGGLRRERGDMFSEAVWMFKDGKWGRRVLAGALGIYFALRLFMLGGFPMPYWVPRAVLVAGFGVWLAVHFWTRGDKA